MTEGVPLCHVFNVSGEVGITGTGYLSFHVSMVRGVEAAYREREGEGEYISL